MRTLVVRFGPVLMLCTLIGFASATAVSAVSAPSAGHDHAETAYHHGDPTHGAGARGGSLSTEGLATDPRGGPPFSLAVFKSHDGRTCAAPGRNIRGTVGAVRNGQFHPYPVEEGATCVDLEKAPAGAQISPAASSAGRTLVFGLAGSAVRHIVVRTSTGSEEVPLLPRGAFLKDLPASVGLGDLTVTAALDDGTQYLLWKGRSVP